MQFSHEIPDYAYALRSADGHQARVNERTLTQSFLLTPESLTDDWPVAAIDELTIDHLQPLIALNPAVVLLGTGTRQIFPPAAIMAACLTRGIGIEVMTNASAARTFNVLASEGRRVAAAFILEPQPQS